MTVQLFAKDFSGEDLVRSVITVSADRATAFEKFRRDIHHWWPHDFTWSGDGLEALFLEGRKNGVLWEQGPEGFRLDWGRVLRWNPPERIIIRWHISPHRMPEPDPSRTSELELKFADTESGTRIELEHRGFSRHGGDWPEYRDLMASEQGWPHILQAFAEWCAPSEQGRLALGALPGAHAAR